MQELILVCPEANSVFIKNYGRCIKTICKLRKLKEMIREIRIQYITYFFGRFHFHLLMKYC